MAGLCRLKVAATAVVAETKRRLGLLSARSYGAAAAVQLDDDYDFDYYEEEESSRYPSRHLPMEGSQRSGSRRGIQWVIMGNPLAKKHLYAERLSKLLEVPHISMGTLVRQELHPQSSLYKQIANAVNQGKLVPEDIIFGLLSKRLEEGHCSGETGFILDGIPRTRLQAEILDQIADIDLVVNFKCMEEPLLNDRLGSGLYPQGEDFFGRDKFSPDRQLKENSNSPNRDSEGVRKEKLCAYAEQSKPLEDYYRQRKKLLEFQVGGAPGETWKGLLAALHLQHMSAASPFPKLAACIT